jgi:uncharacterized membrane protein YgdD (TMEM256/DUF423 family)
MNQRYTVLVGAAMGLSAVVIGAFGAHAFKALLVASGRLAVYELAVQYQFYHALAMLMAGALMTQYNTAWLRYSAISFMSGIILFSGSLYVLSFTGLGVFGAVTPMGGLLFILGWGLVLGGVYRSAPKK